MKNPTWPTIPSTFLSLPPEEHSLEQCEVVILPVPYDSATSYKSGSRDGPSAILRSSNQMEEFDPELGITPSTIGIHTAQMVEPHVGGPDRMVARVEDAVGWYMDKGKMVCMLGGDHSLTPGAIGAAKKHFTDLSVLVLDAHTDLAAEYQGSQYSHACTVRRILEFAPVVLVGVRSMAEGDLETIHQQGIQVFGRQSDPITDLASIVSNLSSNVYISIDLDVFDPSFMASVGTPEPGGMGWWEVLNILRHVAAQRRIVGFDIMELAPAEGPESCTYTAAKLAYKMIAYANFLQ